MKFTKKDWLYIAGVSVSAVIYSFGMNSFVKSGNLFPGGFAGISRLISLLLEKYMHIGVSFSVIYFTLNILTTMLVWKHIGHKFVMYSVLWYTETSLLTQFLVLPQITTDPLLVAVFGGVVSGIAVGIALRCNASSGGTDFISIFLSQKKGVDAFPIILAGNVVILTIAGILFGWDKALYSMIFQYVSTQALHVLYRTYQQKTLFIITDKPQEVCDAIYRNCGHGATLIDGEGSFGHKNKKIVYSIVSASDTRKLIPLIKEIDDTAFINSIRTEEMMGNFYMRPRD